MQPCTIKKGNRPAHRCGAISDTHVFVLEAFTDKHGATRFHLHRMNRKSLAGKNNKR